MECPACRPGSDNEYICDDCRSILTRGGYMILFNFVEAGFGVAMAFAAITHAWVALGIFAFAAFSTAFMVIKEDK